MAHGDRSVDVFIRKLRAKLQKHSPGWTYIHTHFGVGYRFEPEHEVPGAADAPQPTGEPELVEGLAGESVPAAEVGVDVGDARDPAS
jgi:DNA-binding winged helix-turn-helix (wHTH) protein